MISVMGELGAVVIDDVEMPSAYRSASEAPALMGRIIRHEMKAGLEKFFESLDNIAVRTLEDLVHCSLGQSYQAISNRH